MGLKTIKGVDEKTWNEFKALAARRGVKMGRMLGDMIEVYMRYSNEVWEKILNSPRILSEKEVKHMRKVLKKVRSEYGFRR